MLYWPDPSFYLCDAQFPQFCPLVNFLAELLSIALMLIYKIPSPAPSLIISSIYVYIYCIYFCWQEPVKGSVYCLRLLKLVVTEM